MKKIYKINVEGKAYEVELEEVLEIAGTVNSTQVAQMTENVSSTNSTDILAPMPGNIVDIKVNIGDTVSKGQVVAVIEAMKMETEIMSNGDGKITSISASKGDNVTLDQVILTIN